MKCSDFPFNSGLGQYNRGRSNQSDLVADRPGLEVYFSRTTYNSPRFTELKKYISEEERSRADLFHFDEDRNSYVSSHAMLRIVLSRKLGKEPGDILFVRDEHDKPCLNGDNLQFNITHTRNAFAFAVSAYNYVGIDMEKVDRKVDYTSIIRNYFSKGDQEFITGSESEIAERFFLLWTRKEALLKALGVGIVTDLKQFSLYTDEENAIVNSLDSFNFGIECENHFIYSCKVEDYLLSIAVPQENNIILNRITNYEY